MSSQNSVNYKKLPSTSKVKIPERRKTLEIPEKRKNAEKGTTRTRARKKKPDEFVFNDDGTINKGI